MLPGTTPRLRSTALAVIPGTEPELDHCQMS